MKSKQDNKNSLPVVSIENISMDNRDLQVIEDDKLFEEIVGAGAGFGCNCSCGSTDSTDNSDQSISPT